MELSPLGKSAGDLASEPEDALAISYYVDHQMLAHALLGGAQKDEDLDRCGDVMR